MKRFRETKIVSFVLTWILVGGALLLSKGNVYAQTIHSNQYLRDNNDTTQAIDKGSDYKNTCPSPGPRPISPPIKWCSTDGSLTFPIPGTTVKRTTRRWTEL